MFRSSVVVFYVLLSSQVTWAFQCKDVFNPSGRSESVRAYDSGTSETPLKLFARAKDYIDPAVLAQYREDAASVGRNNHVEAVHYLNLYRDNPSRVNLELAVGELVPTATLALRPFLHRLDLDSYFDLYQEALFELTRLVDYTKNLDENPENITYRQRIEKRLGTYLKDQAKALRGELNPRELSTVLWLTGISLRNVSEKAFELNISFEDALEIMANYQKAIDIPSLEPSAFDVLNQKQLVGAVDSAINALGSSRHQQVIRDRYFEGRSFADIAATLGVGTMRTREIEHDALRKLNHPSRGRGLMPFLDPQPSSQPPGRSENPFYGRMANSIAFMPDARQVLESGRITPELRSKLEYELAFVAKEEVVEKLLTDAGLSRTGLTAIAEGHWGHMKPSQRRFTSSWQLLDTLLKEDVSFADVKTVAKEFLLEIKRYESRMENEESGLVASYKEKIEPILDTMKVYQELFRQEAQLKTQLLTARNRWIKANQSKEATPETYTAAQEYNQLFIKAQQDLLVTLNSLPGYNRGALAKKMDTGDASATAFLKKHADLANRVDTSETSPATPKTEVVADAEPVRPFDVSPKISAQKDLFESDFAARTTYVREVFEVYNISPELLQFALSGMRSQNNSFVFFRSVMEKFNPNFWLQINSIGGVHQSAESFIHAGRKTDFLGRDADLVVQMARQRETDDAQLIRSFQHYVGNNAEAYAVYGRALALELKAQTELGEAYKQIIAKGETIPELGDYKVPRHELTPEVLRFVERREAFVSEMFKILMELDGFSDYLMNSVLRNRGNNPKPQPRGRSYGRWGSVI